MELKNKVVAVTGGAGFIGSHLVDDLILQNPEKIVVIDNFFLGKMSNLDDAISSFENLKVYREDAAEYIAMENIFINEGVEVVFDLAVKPLPYSFLNPEGAYMTSINIAHVMVSLLRKEIYETLVHFSSSEACGTAEIVPMTEEHPLNPTTPYAAGKAAADLLFMSYYRTFGINVSIIRPYNNYGPRQNDEVYAAIIPITIKRILNGKKPILEWDGEQSRDFIYVKDTSRAAIDIYKNKNTRGKIINIASGHDTTMKEILQEICKILGYKGKLEHRPRRPGDVRRHVASIDFAKDLIGFEPTVSLSEGLKKTIEWYKKHEKDF